MPILISADDQRVLGQYQIETKMAPNHQFGILECKGRRFKITVLIEKNEQPSRVKSLKIEHMREVAKMVVIMFDKKKLFAQQERLEIKIDQEGFSKKEATANYSGPIPHENKENPNEDTSTNYTTLVNYLKGIDNQHHSSTSLDPNLSNFKANEKKLSLSNTLASHQKERYTPPFDLTKKGQISNPHEPTYFKKMDNGNIYFEIEEINLQPKRKSRSLYSQENDSDLNIEHKKKLLFLNEKEQRHGKSKNDSERKPQLRLEEQAFPKSLEKTKACLSESEEEDPRIKSLCEVVANLEACVNEQEQRRKKSKNDPKQKLKLRIEILGELIAESKERAKKYKNELEEDPILKSIDENRDDSIDKGIAKIETYLKGKEEKTSTIPKRRKNFTQQSIKPFEGTSSVSSLRGDHFFDADNKKIHHHNLSFGDNPMNSFSCSQEERNREQCGNIQDD